MSLVPENPTDCLESAKSQLELVIDCVNWARSLGKTQLISQNVIVALQNLKHRYNYYL